MRQTRIMRCIAAATLVAASLLAQPAGRGRVDLSQATRVPSALIVLYPRGFDCTVASMPAAKFILIVEDRSGRSVPAQIEIDRMPGASLQGSPQSRIHASSVNTRRTHWAQLLDLTPGTYRVRDARRPEWACQIEITPPGR